MPRRCSPGCERCKTLVHVFLNTVSYYNWIIYNHRRIAAYAESSSINLKLDTDDTDKHRFDHSLSLSQRSYLNV